MPLQNQILSPSSLYSSSSRTSSSSPVSPSTFSQSSCSEDSTPSAPLESENSSISYLQQIVTLPITLVGGILNAGYSAITAPARWLYLTVSDVEIADDQVNRENRGESQVLDKALELTESLAKWVHDLNQPSTESQKAWAALIAILSEESNLHRLGEIVQAVSAGGRVLDALVESMHLPQEVTGFIEANRSLLGRSQLVKLFNLYTTTFSDSAQLFLAKHAPRLFTEMLLTRLKDQCVAMSPTEQVLARYSNPMAALAELEGINLETAHQLDVRTLSDHLWRCSGALI